VKEQRSSLGGDLEKARQALLEKNEGNSFTTVRVWHGEIRSQAICSVFNTKFVMNAGAARMTICFPDRA